MTLKDISKLTIGLGIYYLIILFIFYILDQFFEGKDLFYLSMLAFILVTVIYILTLCFLAERGIIA